VRVLQAQAFEVSIDLEATAFGEEGQASSLRLESGLRLWAAATGAPVRGIDMAGVPMEAFVTSADGTRVAVGLRGGRVAVYTLPEGQLMLEHAVQRVSTAPRWAAGVQPRRPLADRACRPCPTSKNAAAEQ